MKNNTLKNISFLWGCTIFLTGCGKKESDDSSSKYESTTLSFISSTCPTTVLSTTTNFSTTTVYPVSTTLTVSTIPIMTSTSEMPISIFSDTNTYSDGVYTTCTVTDTDSEILDLFDKMGETVRDSFDSDELLDKGKSYFIYCVDFLFYDGEIKGVKFDDLTDSAKEQLLLDISNIDSLICSKYPNYKEEIKEGYGNAYNKAGEVIKEGSTNINDFSKEKLGEENYNKLKEYKDLFMDTAFGDWDDFVDIMGKGKQKIKDWYEDFKRKEQIKK